MGIAERERQRFVDKKRKETPCYFKDGITQDEFATLAETVAAKINRVVSVEVIGATVYGVANSQTGQTEWKFNVDFNDWGHITGTRWTWSENPDSNIPCHYGDLLGASIKELLNERNIFLPDYSGIVEQNNVLGTPYGYSYKEGKRLLRKDYRVCAQNDSQELKGEHLYYVFSVLRKAGFKNIKAILVDDVSNEANSYVFEVEMVVINGNSFFEEGDVFGAYDEVMILYHEKKGKRTYISDSEKRKNFWKKHWKKILISFVSTIGIVVGMVAYLISVQYIPVSVSSNELVGKKYEEVVDILENVGFEAVYPLADHSLSLEQIEQEYCVYEVKINDISLFEKKDKFRKDADVYVFYHSLEEIEVPMSAKEMEGDNYQDVILELEKAGFVNIIVVVEYDLITGWITKDGAVESVMIDNDIDYEKGYLYRPDVEIIVTYHTYKKNKPE